MIFGALIIIIREMSASKEQKSHVIHLYHNFKIIVVNSTVDDDINSMVLIIKAIFVAKLFTIAKTGYSEGRCLQRCSNRDSSIAELVVVAAIVVVESDDRSFQECQILKYRRLSRSTYQDSPCAALRPPLNL